MLGNFEKLPAASHPVAKVFCVKHIYMSAFEVALRDNKVVNFRLLPTVNKGLKFHYLSYILCKINGILLLENDFKT